MDRDELFNDLNDHYSKKTLIVLLTFMGVTCSETSNKDELVTLVIEKLSLKEVFETLFRSISAEARIVLAHLTWEGISTLSYIDTKYHIKSSLGDFYDNSGDPFIKIFKLYHSREILLSTGLRYLFKLHISRPVIATSSPNGEELISDTFLLENIYAIFEFIKLNGLRERGVEKKLLSRVVNNFKSEFALNNGSDDIRAKFLLSFIPWATICETPIEILKTFLNQYKNGSLLDSNIDSFLYYPHVKGGNSNSNIGIFLKRGRFSFINKIRSIDNGSWIDINWLIRSLSLEEDTQIFDTSYFGSLLSVKVEPTPSRSYVNKMELLFKSDSEEYLLRPLIYGISTLLFSIGAADIVISNGNPSHIRLSKLGRKLLGLSSDFKMKEKPKFKFSLNDKKLLITTEGEDPALLNFFSRIGKSIGGGLYLVNSSEFFKNCNSEDDVEYNLTYLDDIEENPPEIWVNFKSKIMDRVNPVYNEQELIVVNFPKENTEFLNVLMDNHRVRSLFLMVEGTKGAFTKSNYAIFKKIMKDEGFFL